MARITETKMFAMQIELRDGNEITLRWFQESNSRHWCAFVVDEDDDEFPLDYSMSRNEAIEGALLYVVA